MALATIKSLTYGHVLIIDDDEQVRQTIQALLELEGYQCQTAQSFEHGIEHVRSYVFDLILTDLHLGDDNQTGMDLIDQIVRYDDSIPIILITGYPSVGRAVDAMKRGATDFITKPFDQQMLLHQVAKAIRERNMRLENRRLQAEINKTAVIEKLNRELGRRVDELTRLQAISEGFNEFLDSSSLFERMLSLAGEVTGALSSAVFVIDRQNQCLRLRASRGPAFASVGREHIPLNAGLAGQVAQTGTPIRITRHAAQDDIIGESLLMGNGSESNLILPLLVGREIFGVMQLTNKHGDAEFTREDEQITLALVEKAGIKLENQALYEGIYSNLVDTLTSLVTTIEAKDPYTHEHSQRVTEYAIALARHLQLDDEAIEMLNFAGMLHDIGKIGVRDEILTKPGRLTAEEFEAIKQHPEVGGRIVSPLGLVSDERSIILHHHERYDGSGYPSGLKGEAIPLLARIVSVADAFDAMTSTRSYRRALPVETAIEEMQRNSGSQFDPDVVDAWLALMSEKPELFSVPVPD